MKAKLVLGILGAWSLWSAPAAAQGFWSSSGETALQAVEGGEAKSLGELLDAMRGQTNGSLVDVDFVYRDGRYVYDMTVLEGGVVRGLSYDAGSLERVAGPPPSRLPEIETTLLPPPPGHAAGPAPAPHAAPSAAEGRRLIWLAPQRSGEAGHAEAQGRPSWSGGGEVSSATAAAARPSRSGVHGGPGLSAPDAFSASRTSAGYAPSEANPSASPASPSSPAEASPSGDAGTSGGAQTESGAAAGGGQAGSDPSGPSEPSGESSSGSASGGSTGGAEAGGGTSEGGSQSGATSEGGASEGGSQSGGSEGSASEGGP